MVIDPTENETAVHLLTSRIFNAESVRICQLGDFSKDRQESAYIDVISQVKQAMADGTTVILINSGPIQTSFYDVFNRHFAEEFVRNPNAQPGAADAHIRQYTAKLAVGSLSSTYFHSHSIMSNEWF